MAGRAEGNLAWSLDRETADTVANTERLARTAVECQEVVWARWGGWMEQWGAFQILAARGGSTVAATFPTQALLWGQAKRLAQASDPQEPHRFR